MVSPLRLALFIPFHLLCVNQFSLKMSAVLHFRIINPNSHAPFFVSRLSPRKGRGPKMGVPRLGFEPGASRTKCTVHPWHATRVSLPGQRFRSHMRPASIGLNAFSSLPLVGFCWTVDG